MFIRSACVTTFYEVSMFQSFPNKNFTFAWVSCVDSGNKILPCLCKTKKVFGFLLIFSKFAKSQFAVLSRDLEMAVTLIQMKTVEWLSEHTSSNSE